MSKLEKYANYYLNKYKNREYEYKNNLEFLNKYNYTFDKFITYSFLDFLYILYAGSSVNNFYLFEGLIDKYQEYFSRVTVDDYPELESFFNQVYRLHNSNEYENCKLNKKTNREFKKIPFNKNTKKFLTKIFTKEDGNVDLEAYNEFIICFLNSDSLNIFRSIKELMKFKFTKKEAESIEGHRKRLIDKVVNEHSQLPRKILSVITSVKYKLETENKDLEKNKKKNIGYLEKILEDIKKKKIIDLNDYKRLDEPKILTEIVIYNSELNNDIYDSLVNENKGLKGNDIGILEEELLNSNIDIDLDMLEVSLSDAKEKIEILKKYSSISKYNNIMLYLINNISKENIRKLFNLVNDNILDEEFILNNIIYIKDENNLINIFNIINLFKDNNMDIINVLKYNKDVLFFNYNHLLLVLNTYKKYGIDLSKECYNYEFLFKDMTYIIDSFIEIGEYELIKNNLSLLNSNSIMIIKRCILYKELNNSLVNDAGKLRGSLRKEENFIMSDSELNETIISNSNSFIKDDIVECLNNNINKNNKLFNLNVISKYLVDEYTYKFNNILISKNKIIKNLNILYENNYNELYSDKDLLLYSIIYNFPNILTKEDIEYVKNIINDKKKLLLV